MEERQEFDSPIPLIFMRKLSRLTLWMPTAARVRLRLIGSRFVLTPERYSQAFGDAIRPFNRVFLPECPGPSPPLLDPFAPA